MACPLCENPHIKPEPIYPKMALFVECTLCGRFQITMSLAEDIHHDARQFAALLPYLRAHTKQAAAAGAPALLDTKNYEQLATRHTNTSVEEKMRRILVHIQGLSSYPGHVVALDPDVYPLFNVAESGHMAYLLDALVTRGDLTPQGPNKLGHPQWTLTPAAWARLTSHGPAGELGTVFVAMAFTDDMNQAYNEGIHPAVVNDCKLTITHVGRIQYNDSISDKILAGIRAAQVVIADVTHQRNGVYFEGGFAMGLGRDVIWMCREDNIGEVHFDTSHYNHIVWKDHSDLRQRLAARLRGTVTIPAQLSD